MLHTGGNEVSLKEVQTCETPVPTKTHYPIAHYDFYNQVSSNLENIGLEIVHEQHALAKDGNRYFGLLQVDNGNEDQDYGLVIGLRNSHDKRFPAGFCVGSGVFVCDNLAFSSEIVLARKHTLNIFNDLPNMVMRGIGQLTEHRQLQHNRIESYKNTGLTNQEAESAIIELLRVKAVLTTQIIHIVNQWDNPSYPEFAENRNVYRLFNAVTTTMKGNTSLEEIPRRSFALHGVCDQLSGVTIQGN